MRNKTEEPRIRSSNTVIQVPQPDGSLVETNSFTVIFLKMAIGLWSDGFPEKAIQGVKRRDALNMAGKILGRTYSEKQIQDAHRALNDLWERMIDSRGRNEDAETTPSAAGAHR